MTTKGIFNSSITRVRPVFKQLIHRSKTEWLTDILNLFPSEYAKSLATNTGLISPETVKFCLYNDKILGQKEYGIDTIELEKCFEYSMEPSVNFLRWLIMNPNMLTWPKGMKYSKNTEIKRRVLIGGDTEIKEKALAELFKCGSNKSSKKWWAFEGFTEIDCLIETDSLILAVEGKRTEDGPSKSTSWYKNRNQIIRNLEVLQQKAMNKPFAVILIDDKNDFKLTQKDIYLGLPHMTVEERIDLITHYLGSVTWQKVCEATGINYNELPDRTQEVVEIINKNARKRD